MSQIIFRNPIVSASAVLVGTGNGTLTIDKLTHFTVTQNYTATCVAKSPDTLFSIAGSLDGAIGIATVGQQFFDPDLKIFLTIQQGSTAFEVGDEFTFSVQNGTDLNQQNIDTYDELPQKNFGAGVLGLARGDHNLRYSDTSTQAYKYLQDLFFQAVATGSSGDSISIEYLEALNGTPASLIVQDLTFTSIAQNSSGNSVTFQYANATPATPASLIIQDIRFQALNTLGASGNNISIAFASGGTAGSEVVTVVGDFITVTIESGVSTANQIITKILASTAAMALLATVALKSGGIGTNTQTAVSQTFLTGGIDASGQAGSEVVSVSGTAITVKMESGVSTATQIKAALDASIAASALITTAISGTGSNAQTASPTGPTNLTGGLDGQGLSSPFVSVSSSAIQVYFRSGYATATQIKAALDGSGAAAALITTTIIGAGSNPQLAPIASSFLSGGRNKFFAFNHNEFTDSTNFAEGNASLKVKDITAGGKLDLANAAKISGPLALLNSESGSSVPDAQRYINSLISKGKILITTSNGSRISYSSGQISFTAPILITFKDTGVINTLALSNSPISISDGQSLYVTLSPTVSTEVTAVVGSSISSNINAFRLATRVGSILYFDNGTSLADGESARFNDQGASSTNLADALIRRDSSGDFSAHNATLNKAIVAPGSGKGLDTSSPGVMEIGATSTKVDIIAPLGLENEIVAKQLVTPTNPSSGYNKLYFKNDGNLYRLDSSGSEAQVGKGGTIHATFYDPVSTSLPTGTSATFDDVAITNNDRVLFTNLGSGNNRIYKVTGVGTSLVWTTQADFVTGLDPIAGDQVIIDKGTKFGLQTAIFDGTDFQFNNVVRYFNGTDFWETTSIKTGTLTDNSSGTLFSVTAAGSENIWVDYSILRGTSKENGTAVIINDGSDASITAIAGILGATAGVTLTASISGANVVFGYSTTNTGTSGTIKYTVRRWSDSSNGPTGVTSYTGATPPTAAAAGSNTQIQYNSSGSLGADSSFTWDASSKILQINGLSIQGLQGPITLANNTTSATTFLTIDGSVYPSVFIKYSIVRDGIRRQGRMMITTIGSDLAFEDDFITTGADGIILSATLVGTNILIQFTSTNSGFSGSFKYSTEMWN